MLCSESRGFNGTKGSETTQEVHALLDIDTHCINLNGPVDFIVHVDAKVSEIRYPFGLLIVDVNR